MQDEFKWNSQFCTWHWNLFNCKEFMLYILVTVSNIWNSSFWGLFANNKPFIQNFFLNQFMHAIFVSKVNKIMNYYTLHHSINILHKKVLRLENFLTISIFLNHFIEYLLVFVAIIFLFFCRWQIDLLFDQFFKRKTRTSLPIHILFNNRCNSWSTNNLFQITVTSEFDLPIGTNKQINANVFPYIYYRNSKRWSIKTESLDTQILFYLGK